MGKSRNQRSKHESSFLESVKSLLQQLIEEIGEIKVSVNYMRFAENCQDPFGGDSPWWHETCEPYNMGHQPDSQRPEPLKILQALQDTSVTTSPTRMRAAAMPFSPNPTKCVHQRADILAYRCSHGEHQKKAPVELHTLVVQHEESSHEVGGQSANKTTEVADCRSCPAQFWKTLYAKFADSKRQCRAAASAKACRSAHLLQAWWRFRRKKMVANGFCKAMEGNFDPEPSREWCMFDDNIAQTETSRSPAVKAEGSGIAGMPQSYLTFEPRRPPSAYFLYAMHCSRAGRDGISLRWSTMPLEEKNPSKRYLMS